MSNIFLNSIDSKGLRDTETALLLEKAIVSDIGDAVAYTDGEQIFLNTDENLYRILPNYDAKLMKKWLLWHEKTHINLRHNDRFFKYIDDLEEKELKDKFHVTQAEVNIIMDIIVHDWMTPKFPELVDIALSNLAQFRNRNSLKHTFKTFTLEEMLNEYAEVKKDRKKEPGDGDGDGGAGTKGKSKDKKDKSEDKSKDKSRGKSKDEPKDESKDKSEDKEDKSKDKEDKSKDRSKDKSEDKSKDKHSTGDAEKGKPKIEDATRPLEDEHDKTDWSKLEQIDSKEFITKKDGEIIKDAIAKLKRKKLKLAKLTETLNGLVTATRKRTYSMPSLISTGSNVILKGSRPGRAKLYLIFDASGSMHEEMATFKEIISKSIPQAMNCPCEWFAGDCAKIKPYKMERL